MSDDWRLRIDLHDSGMAHQLTERLQASELEHDLERAFEDRVVVSRDGAEVFCYARTREQAERAEQLVRSLATQHGWAAEMELRRWHPTAQEWADPAAPLPQSPSDQAAEHAERIENEREEARDRGYPLFEVRVECASREEASELAERLRAEGVPSVQRWRYLLIGAVDEDSASALADRLLREVPPGTDVTVEGTLGAALQDQPYNPFAVLGGLAG